MNSILHQYRSIKKRYPDAILLFRVGDIYQCFLKDADVVCGCLKTAVEKSSDSEGCFVVSFPHYQLDNHLRKLVKLGHRVAICEQLQTDKKGEG